MSQTLWTSVGLYGFAILLVCLAAGLTLLLPPVAEGTPFLFFFAAVMLSAWYGGLGPALLTILLAAGWSNYFLLPPLYSLQVGAPADMLRLSLFLLVAFLISFLQARQQGAAVAERVQREYLQVTLASIGDAVIVTDAQGNVTTLNPVAQRLTGWTLDAAQGKPLLEVFPLYNEETRQPVENPVAKVLRTGTVAGLANHTVLVTKEGREIPIDDSAAPIRDAQGRLLGIVLVFRDITERRQAEQVLRDSEARYRTLFESIDEGFCVIEPVRDTTGEVVEFRYVQANPAFAAQSGGSNVVGKTIRQVFPSEPEEWIDTYTTVLNTGEPRRFVRTLVTHGRVLDLFAFRIVDGTHPRVAVLFKDITARKQAEETRLRLAAIVETSDDAIISKSLDGVVTSWNAAAERIFGYTAEEMIGQPILRLLPEDRQAEEQMILARLRRGERVDHFETVRRAKDGRLLDVSVTISPLRDERGVIIGASKIARDITERKRNEEALRRSEQELADFFENATVGLHWVGPDGTILRVNQAELDLLGYTREEYVGHHIAEFHADQEAITDILRRLTRGDTVKNYEAQLRRKDGSLRSVLIDSSVLREEGHFIHTRCFTRDITERKQLEGKLTQRSAELEHLNTELQHFSYIVSHDLNEPLRTMSSFISLLARQYQGQLDATADEYIGFVTEAARRMQGMITDLLAYTRAGGQAQKFAVVDCAALLTRVLGDFQLAIKDCAAEVTHDVLPTVYGDVGHLGLVFQNLLGNALKFRSESPPCIHVAARREGAQWVFSVRDNGIGLDPQYAERIFQVFQRLHTRGEYPGTGIGLAICKKIVERHGGRIWVESEPGMGATFFFTLPIL